MFTLLEIKILDPWMWKTFGFDKPWSTTIWIVLNCWTGFILDHWVGLNWSLSYLALAVSFRFACFNYIYNLVYGHAWDYLGLDWWDRMKSKIVAPFRVALEAWILLVGVMQFLYLGCWIYTDPMITITFNLLRYCDK